MKQSRKFESGRTMIEMIAVLLIIAILTVASLGGFSFVMKTWRQRQTIDQINAIALGMRAGNLAQRYASGEQVPVKAVVRGLKTKDGVVAVLPDDEQNSYATVRSLGVNAYLLEVQMAPETCEEFLGKLASNGERAQGIQPDIVATCNGTIDDQGNCSVEAQTLTDSLKNADKSKTKEEVICEICAGQPKTALIWGCSEGANNYWYGGQCHFCPKGQDRDANGVCCDKTKIDPVTKLCPVSEICPEGTYWWEEGKTCVQCLKTEHCPNTIFAQHICDTIDHKCVECLENKHRSTVTENLAKKPVDPSPRDDDWVRRKCNPNIRQCIECTTHTDCPVDEVVVGKKVSWVGVCLETTYMCSKCIKSYKGTGEKGECPQELPYCNNPGTTSAFCSQCVPELVWSTERQECICENGAEPRCTEQQGSTCLHYACDQICVEWDSPVNPNKNCAIAGHPGDTCIGPHTESHESLLGCHDCVKDLSELDEFYGVPERCSSVKPMCDSKYAATLRQNGTEGWRVPAGAFGRKDENDRMTNKESIIVTGETASVTSKYLSSYTCKTCLRRKNSSGAVYQPDFGCTYDKPLCDENKERCGCRTTAADCPADMYCTADNLLHKTEFGECRACPKNAVRDPGNLYCRCRDGLRKVCKNGMVADVAGNKCGSEADAGWTCESGCLANTDCPENQYCSTHDQNATSSTGQVLGKCTPCPTKRPFRKKEDMMCSGCLCADIIRDAQGRPLRCDKSKCTANQICVMNSKCRAAVDSHGDCQVEEGEGICLAKPKLYKFNGVTAKNRTYYIPTPGDKYKLTWIEAGNFCKAYNMRLATVEEACLKNLHADSGHDCPNITGVRGSGSSTRQICDEQGQNCHPISTWQGSDHGTFWIDAKLPRTCKSLRVTSTCGNNHPTYICDSYYPLCVKSGSGGAYVDYEEEVEARCPCGADPNDETQCATPPSGECGYTISVSKKGKKTCQVNPVPNCAYGHYFEPLANQCRCNETECLCGVDGSGKCLPMPPCAEGWEVVSKDGSCTCERIGSK